MGAPIETGAEFGRFADFYTEKAEINIGYQVSELALLDALSSHILASANQQAQVLEFGAGSGVSGFRMMAALRAVGISSVEWTATEFNQEMISQGKGRIDALPVMQADVQDLSRFSENSFDAVVSSQVMHWVPDIPKALEEMRRVLRPGGMMITCASGLFEGMRALHFTQHPFYRQFLTDIEQYLEQIGYWTSPTDGVFEPANPRVNSFFHRYSVVEVLKMIEKSGMVGGALRYFEAPITRQGMVDVRMQTGNTFMFLWNGERTKTIPREVADAAVTYAREKVLTNLGDRVNILDTEPTSDATLRFTAWKPQ